jgi:hypothetical protein
MRKADNLSIMQGGSEEGARWMFGWNFTSHLHKQIGHWFSWNNRNNWNFMF